MIKRNVLTFLVVCLVSSADLYLFNIADTELKTEELLLLSKNTSHHRVTRDIESSGDEEMNQVVAIRPLGGRRGEIMQRLTADIDVNSEEILSESLTRSHIEDGSGDGSGSGPVSAAMSSVTDSDPFIKEEGVKEFLDELTEKEDREDHVTEPNDDDNLQRNELHVLAGSENSETTYSESETFHDVNTELVESVSEHVQIPEVVTVVEVTEATEQSKTVSSRESSEEQGLTLMSSTSEPEEVEETTEEAQTTETIEETKTEQTEVEGIETEPTTEESTNTEQSSVTSTTEEATEALELEPTLSSEVEENETESTTEEATTELPTTIEESTTELPTTTEDVIEQTIEPTLEPASITTDNAANETVLEPTLTSTEEPEDKNTTMIVEANYSLISVDSNLVETVSRSSSDDEILTGGLQSKRIGAYIVVSLIVISFVGLIGYIMLKNRRRKRGKMTEAREATKEAKEDKALLSLSEYKDNPENGGLKNNEKNTIFKPTNINLEKNTNFSSCPKNLNINTNEKNITKDNNINSLKNSTVTDLAEVIVEQSPKQNGALHLEKHVVKTLVDEDSIPKRPVIVERCSGEVTENII